MRRHVLDSLFRVGLYRESECSRLASCEPRATAASDVLRNHGAVRSRVLRLTPESAAERSGSMSSIKRDVKKKVLPRPEGEKILSRDPAHFTVRVPLDLRERFRF